MKKTTILYIIIAFLLIANGIFLYSFSKKNKHKRQRPEMFIVKQLEFTDKQFETFKTMSDLHFENRKTISRNIRALKDQLFSKVSDDNVDLKFVDSITALIADYEKDKDYRLFLHLQKVRDICNDEQKEKFELIMKKALNRGEKHSKKH